MALFRHTAVVLALFLSAPALAQTISAPVPGKPAAVAPGFDLTPLGYVMEEFFISGEASSFVPVGELTGDGKWTVKAEKTAPYTTRAVVIRPVDPKKFNGTVLAEWLNVSAGGDTAPDFANAHREMLRSGYAWVGVSAQRVGIYGPNAPAGGANAPAPANAPNVGARHLKALDPARYEKLAHPGDAYAYDIFTQIGKSIRDGKLTGGAKPKRVIATGQSQSAGYMTTYANAIDPISKAFDGYLVHVRSGGSARLGPDVPAVQGPVRFRPDMRVPLLAVESETDVISYHRARVPDSDKIRVWEVAGTSHVDTYTYALAAIDSGLLSIEDLAKGWALVTNAQGTQLAKALNAAPQHHYMMNAAIDALNRWAGGGKAPAKAAPLEITTGEQPAYVVDAHGNVKGGARSPWVDVPTATLSGLSDEKGFARTFGTTVPFDAAKLRQLYPGGKADYLRKFEAELKKAIRAGFILEADAKEIRGLAAALYPAN